MIPGIVLSSRALKDLKALDAQTQQRITAALERLYATGYGDVVALKGEFGGSSRLRAGKWRIFFFREKAEEIVAYRIDNRGQAY